MAITSLETLTEASEELEHAHEWYERQRPGLGAEFLDSVGRTVAFLLEYPDTGTTIPAYLDSEQLRRVPIRRFPFHLVYVRMDERIVIIAFAHDRRSPGYWRTRTGQ